MLNSDLNRPSVTEATWLRAVVETAVDGVILIDAHGNVLMFNPACELLFGYEAAEVIGDARRVGVDDKQHASLLAREGRPGDVGSGGCGLVALACGRAHL